MFKKYTKTINVAVVIIFFFSAFTSVSYSENGMPNIKPVKDKKLTDLIINCPAEVVYQIQEIPDWNAGFSSLKRLTFEKASSDGKNLYCNYESAGQSSLLIRPLPPGFICGDPGGKNRQFVCKKNVPPIKIKPKNK